MCCAINFDLPLSLLCNDHFDAFVLSFSEKFLLYSDLKFKYCVFKMPGKRLSFDITQLLYYNYHLGKSVQELSEMFSVTRQTVYNVINRAEKEGRLEQKRAGGPKTKITGCAERLMIRKLDQNPRISLRTLAKELNEECGIIVSHEAVRQAILHHKYSSRSARKKPLLSAQNVEKRLSFALNHISEPEDYWDDVIFCDETKIMLYYNDGPTRVWRKPLTGLQNRNIIPTVKFGKISVMVWGCISSKGVGDLVFIDGTMDAKQYLNILKKNLVGSAKKFGFITENKPNFKFYQDNDPKHKEHNVQMWLLYNCVKVINTPAQSPDINVIENLWAFLKKRVAKRRPKNAAALKTAIMEEWQNIPNVYDVNKLVHSMKKRLQNVIEANGYHTKY